MKKLQILLVGLLMLAASSFFAKDSYASNFSTDYNVTYSVLDNAKTRVTFDISLTNNTSQYYASSYKIILGFTDIEGVSARDSLGSITPEVTKVQDGTQVSVTFNNKVVGQGNRQNFSVIFDTDEISEHSGNVWEVNIPGISEQNDFSSFNVKVIPPKASQNLLYIKPQVNVQNNSNVISFNQNQLGNSGISITYGDYQVYKFYLKYHLKNSNLFPINTEVALPPSTGYQDIQISNINPAPSNIKKDLDGNWLAEFTVSPMKEVTVTAQGYSKLYLKPREEAISQEQIKLYTKPDKYWETQNPRIQKLSKTLKTPRQIYDYVTSNLSYDFERVSNDQVRVGAANVLKDPSSAVCLEFTDLFVGMARAAGIPARAVEGYANTQNSKERPLSLVADILHAWPEYYDFEKKAWVMVDPTWANTTKGVDYFNVLDLDHLAFVIKGNDSEYPIPAGGYKQKGDEQVKDVEVAAKTLFPSIRKSLNGKIDITDHQVSFLPIKGAVVVENTGNFPVGTQVVKLSSDLKPKEIVLNTPEILPYQKITLPFSLATSGVFSTGDKNLKLETANQVIVKSIKINLIPLNWLIYIAEGVVAVVIITVLSVVAYKSWSLFISRRERESNLRGQSPKY